MKESAHASLQNLIENRGLRLRFIIAPPRTGSTVLEASLSGQGKEIISCHEPFVRFGYYGGEAEEGYQNIWNTLKRDEAGSVLPNQAVLVKEMAHWVDKDEKYKEIFELVADPIIFLIRNPLLCAESRIRKVLQTFSMREKPSLQQFLFDRFSNPTTVSETRGADVQTLALQQDLLDRYARSCGHDGWDLFLQDHLKRRDYAFFEELLEIDGIFPLDSSGWIAFDKEQDYLNRLERRSVIADSTVFRLAPQDLLQKICFLWGLKFSRHMTEWGDEIRAFDTGQHKPHYELWYDTLLSSHQIKHPVEPALPLSRFPETLRGYMLEHDIPIYIHAFMGGELLAKNSQMAQSMRDIDPFVACLLNPELLSDQRFREEAFAHNDVLEVLEAYMA